MPAITGAIDARRRITRQSLQNMATPASRAVTRKPRARLGPEKISVARLPITGSDVFGREKDIAFLDAAWADQNVNVVTIVAWAGVGKSTLVNHWLRRIAGEHYRSAELVFGSSFYRQGTGGDTSSAEEFLDAALTWFGDSDPRLGTAWEKGERLAKLVARRKSYLERYGGKPWTRVEHEAIRARVMETRYSPDKREKLRILPIRVGDGEVGGILFNTIVPNVCTKAAGKSHITRPMHQKCPSLTLMDRLTPENVFLSIFGLDSP
jgi:hypothetical protein